MSAPKLNGRLIILIGIIVLAGLAFYPLVMRNQVLAMFREFGAQASALELVMKMLASEWITLASGVVYAFIYIATGLAVAKASNNARSFWLLIYAPLTLLACLIHTIGYIVLFARQGGLDGPWVHVLMVNVVLMIVITVFTLVSLNRAKAKTEFRPD